MGVLPACILSVPMYAMPTEARGRHQIPLELKLWMALRYHVGLGTETDSSAGGATALY